MMRFLRNDLKIDTDEIRADWSAALDAKTALDNIMPGEFSDTLAKKITRPIGIWGVIDPGARLPEEIVAADSAWGDASKAAWEMLDWGQDVRNAFPDFDSLLRAVGEAAAGNALLGGCELFDNGELAAGAISSAYVAIATVARTPRKLVREAYDSLLDYCGPCEEAFEQKRRELMRSGVERSFHDLLVSAASSGFSGYRHMDTAADAVYLRMAADATDAAWYHEFYERIDESVVAEMDAEFEKEKEEEIEQYLEREREIDAL